MKSLDRLILDELAAMDAFDDSFEPDSFSSRSFAVEKADKVEFLLFDRGDRGYQKAYLLLNGLWMRDLLDTLRVLDGRRSLLHGSTLKSLQENIGSATGIYKGRLALAIDAVRDSRRVEYQSPLIDSFRQRSESIQLPQDQKDEISRFLMYRQWTRYLARTGNPPVIGENDIDVIINYTIRARDNFPNWQSKLQRVRCIQGKRPPCYQYRSRAAMDPRPSISVNNPDHLAEWNCLEKCEGGVSSINTYDSQILTWGRGQGGATGPLPVAVNLFCQNDAIAGQKLFDVGIFVDFNELTLCSGRNAWNVIDINNRSIRSGSGGLMLIAQDIKLLSVLIDIAEDPEHSQAWVNAQFRVFSICRPAWTSCKVSSNPPLQCDLSAIK